MHCRQHPDEATIITRDRITAEHLGQIGVMLRVVEDGTVDCPDCNCPATKLSRHRHEPIDSDQRP